VNCRLRPRHSLRNGLVYSRRPSSSRTRRNQYDAVGTLSCARRRNDVIYCNDRSTCPHMTSSTTPETHNVSQRRQSRTQPRPLTFTYFLKIGHVVPEICSLADRHTDTHTNRQTHRHAHYSCQLQRLSKWAYATCAVSGTRNFRKFDHGLTQSLHTELRWLNVAVMQMRMTFSDLGDS